MDDIVVSVDFIGNTVEVIRQSPVVNFKNFDGRTYEDGFRYKEIWQCIDGEFALVHRIPGKHTPATQIAESFTFN